MTTPPERVLFDPTDMETRAFYRVPMDHVFVPTTGSPVLPVLSLFARRKA